MDTKRFLLALVNPFRLQNRFERLIGVHVMQLAGGWHVEVLGIITHWYRRRA